LGWRSNKKEQGSRHASSRIEAGIMLDFLVTNRPLIATLAGVVALLLLILARRMPAFPALLIAALFTGLAAGLAPDAVISAIQNGMGGVLGFIAVIVGLGAILGVFLEAGGGAKAMANWLIGNRSGGMASFMMGLVGIIIATPVFFDVGLILLIPLVMALARKAAAPALRFGLPLLAGLAAAHAFIPPTPGPIVVANILGAELGDVIRFGLMAGVPAMLVGGPLYARFAETRGWLDEALLPDINKLAARVDGSESRSLAIRALTCILIPLVLIVLGAVSDTLFAKFPDTVSALKFVGHPFVALLIACGLAWALLRPEDEASQQNLKEGLSRAFEPTAAIILVTGAGGAFKQVLIDTGAGAAMAEATLAVGLTPVVASFSLAALVRIAQGSATVAMLTAAGLVAPIAVTLGVGQADLALMTIAIAAGATVASHVNDSGFWLVSKYFNLSLSQTLRTWSVASTLVGLTGFAIVLLISAITNLA
jgi:Gnt-I system low-affinity gluconate transporter